MNSPFMGEFAGTLVLILLGDGVVANVLLKRSKAEGGGMDCDHRGMGVCRTLRHLHGGCVRQRRCTH